MFIHVDYIELLSLKTSLELLDTIFGETEQRNRFLEKVDTGLALFEKADTSASTMADIEFVVH